MSQLHKEKAISNFTENFVDEDTAKSITEFLDTLSFKDENGHSVIAFGAPYKYNGSASNTENQIIPDELQPLVNQINGLQEETFFNKYPDSRKYERPSPQVNSLLINKYEGADSYLPKHSDDEETVHPESNIFTLSLGANCTVNFSPVLSNAGDSSSTINCSNRSLYSMSRKSQDFFKHEIRAGQIQNGTRYSLTFRAVNRWNNNSTCIIGDSNTGRLTFGSDKRKTFGELMPGHRFWAPTVETIDPSVCCSYNNVIIMCGINDIKKQNVDYSCNIDNIYNLYQSKVAEIRSLNPKCRIFVCPILPTKNHDLNRGALYFNKLIFEDLIKRDLNVQCVWGFDDFLDGDGSGLLSRNLSKEYNRHNQPDILHLNLSGIRRLAGLIKQSVFSRFKGGKVSERKAGSSRVNGRPYSEVVVPSNTSLGVDGSAI